MPNVCTIMLFSWQYDCFIINTSAALAASATDIANTIKSRHAMQEQALTQFLQQRQAQGELPAGRDVAQLAHFLFPFIFAPAIATLLAGPAAGVSLGIGMMFFNLLFSHSESMLPVFATSAIVAVITPRPAQPTPGSGPPDSAQRTSP